jgi:hypothetical protein
VLIVAIRLRTVLITRDSSADSASGLSWSRRFIFAQLREKNGKKNYITDLNII